MSFTMNWNISFCLTSQLQKIVSLLLIKAREIASDKSCNCLRNQVMKSACWYLAFRWQHGIYWLVILTPLVTRNWCFIPLSRIWLTKGRTPYESEFLHWIWIAHKFETSTRNINFSKLKDSSVIVDANQTNTRMVKMARLGEGLFSVFVPRWLWVVVF